MAIYRKIKFTLPKKVGRPEIGAAHKSQKVDGPRPAQPNRLRRQWIWCILGLLFLRFVCPMDCSCMINFIEVGLSLLVPNERYRLANPCLHKLRYYRHYIYCQ